MSKNFVEMRFRNGEVSGRVRLHRMVGADEVPTILHGALHGLELGRAAAGAWARGGASDVDVGEPHEATAARYDAPASSDLWEARAEAEWLTQLWYDVLNGVGPLRFKAPTMLHYALMGQAMLVVSVQGLKVSLSIRGADGTHDKERIYIVSVERANVQEIRAFVLWLIRSSGIPASAPPGWPDPPASEEPPNGAGERYVPFPVGAVEDSSEARVGRMADAAPPPFSDHHARAFWRVALQGLPEHSQADGRLYFHAGEDGMLGVTPLHNAAAVFCHNTKTGVRRGHYLYIDNSIDDIRSYILWALRSAGVVLETPYGWPVVTDLETPPNVAGAQITDDVAGAGADVDGFEEV